MSTYALQRRREAASADRDRRIVLIVMCVGYFLVLLDVTIVNVALPTIGDDLGASVAGLQWVVDGYALTLASLMLAGGTIGDLHGHKRVVLSGLVLFGVASLACAIAPGTGALVVARVFQGLGAALLLPGTLATITHAFPDRAEQRKAIGIWAGIGSAALPAGPLLGGALVDGIGWRAVFLVNLPIALAALVVAARVVDETPHSSSRRLDFAGTALGAGVLASFTFSIIEIGNGGLGGLAVGGVLMAAGLLAALIAVERASPDPMLPLPLFRRPAFSASNAIAGSMNLGTLGVLFVLTLYLQSARGDSPLTAGALLIPLFLPLVLIAPFAGRLTARIGPPLPMAEGLIAAAAGLALLTFQSSDSNYATLLPALLLWGVGIAFLTPAVVAAAMASVDVKRAGLAAAVNNTSRQAGGAIGIAVMGAIAGSPGSSGFLGGMHAAALAAAALYCVAAVATFAFVPRSA
jgi:DHA2 family methylenomycin A resistance protein-like MFS transporter